MMQQQPPLLSSPCAPFPKNISHHFERLLVGCCIPPSSRSHEIQGPVALSFFFRRSNHRPKRRVNVLPTQSSPAASPIKLPPCQRHHHSVHFCVDPMSGGHPKPVLCPSQTTADGGGGNWQTTVAAAMWTAAQSMDGGGGGGGRRRQRTAGGSHVCDTSSARYVYARRNSIPGE